MGKILAAMDNGELLDTENVRINIMNVSSPEVHRNSNGWHTFHCISLPVQWQYGDTKTFSPWKHSVKPSNECAARLSTATWATDALTNTSSPFTSMTQPSSLKKCHNIHSVSVSVSVYLESMSHNLQQDFQWSHKNLTKV